MHHGNAGASRRDVHNLGAADAVRLLEILHDCAGCRSRPAFQNLFPKIQAVLPFDFALAVTGRLEGGVALAVDGINVSFPEGWIREYAAASAFARDALVRASFETRSPLSWSDATKRLAKPNALPLCRDFGMRHGHVAGLEPLYAGRASSLLCFAGTTGRPDRRARVVLRHLLPHLHLALQLALGEPTAPPTPGPALSSRETEVLQWLKEGKTSWDISMILGIRERTVNFHAANIMRKLGAVNRVQAVAVALRRGLIGID